MRRKKRTEIMVEQHELLIIHAPAVEENTKCHICPTRVQMVSAEDAATILNMTRREIYRAVETGNVHFMETNEGLLLVCIQSLFSLNSPIQFQEKQLYGSKEIETDF